MYITLVIVIFSVLFAVLAQRNKVPATNINSSSLVYKYYDFNFWFLILSYALLALMCFFSKNGDDIPAYSYYYSNWTLSDLLDFEIEIGYKALCMALRTFIKNPYIGLGIIKLLSTTLFFQSLYLLRDKINIGFAVFAYVCILYVHSFHLLRIMIAVGIVYLAYALIINNKLKSGLVLLLVAILFHYSSALVLLAYVIYLFVRKGLTFNKLLIIFGILIALYLNVEILINLGINHLGIMSKYSLYLSDVDSGTGMAQFLLFIPVAYIIITLNKSDMHDEMYILCSILGMLSFFAGSLGYIFVVISRTTYYFNYFIIVFCASMPLRKDKVYINAGFTVINLRTLLSFGYILLYLAFTYIIPGKEIEILTDYQFFWA